MKDKYNDYQEFFISDNEEEINTEKAKQQALIKYLPGFVGNEDKTTYILRREDVPAKKIEAGWRKECTNKETTGLKSSKKSFDFDIKGKNTELTQDRLKQVSPNGSLNNSAFVPVVNNSIIQEKTNRRHFQPRV